MKIIDNLRKYLLYAIILSITIGTLGRIPLDIPPINIYITDLLISVLVLSWITSYSKLFNIIKKDSIAKSSGVFMIILLISNILSPLTLTWFERLVSLLYLFRFTGYFFVYLTVTSLLQQKIIRNINLLNILLITGILSALVGWVQYLLYPDLRNLYYLGWDPHDRRIFGSFFDPNYLGLLYALTIMLILIFKAKSIIFKTFGIGIFLTLAFTYSRSSYLSLISSISYFLIKAEKVRYLLLIIAVLIITMVMLPRAEIESLNLARIFTITERVNRWGQAYEIFSRYPILGIGFNTLRTAQRNFGFLSDDWLSSHSAAGVDNSLLFVGATSGIIGLIVLIYLILTIWRNSKILGKISLIAILTHSLFLNSLFFPWIMIWLWVTVSLDQVKVKENI